MSLAAVETLHLASPSSSRGDQPDYRELQVEIVRRLAVVAEYRDDYSGAHSAHVAAISGAIARSLGLGTRRSRMIELVSPLHDLGKVAIPDAILLKPGPLTSCERNHMQRHTVIGGQMLEHSPLPALQLARQIALGHHEHWDGGGYPHERKAHDIPQAARIVALADVFDALTSDRPYKEAWSPERALEEVTAQRGRQFDPDVVDAFMRIDHEIVMNGQAPAGERAWPSLADES